MNRAIVTVDATAEVRHHCDHSHGGVSWSLCTPGYNGVTVYIDGTPDELRDFANRLFDAADAHDQVSD